MTSLVLSTVAFVVASFLVRRRLDGMGIPRDMVSGLTVLVVALAVAYGVAALVDWVGSP